MTALPQSLQDSESNAPIPEPRPTPMLDRARDRYDKLVALLQAPPDILDPDYVHDLRVLTRRVTEIVRLMKPLFDPAIALGISGALRDLRKSAADLRDMDVLVEHLERWRLPRPLRIVVQGLIAELPARRATLETELRLAISSTSTQGLLMLLGRTLGQTDSAAESRMETELRKLIRRRRKKMEKLFGTAARKQSDVSLHNARIGVKKLRYAVEIGESAGIRGSSSAVRTLKALQELLGKHHDVSVIADVLRNRLKLLATPSNPNKSAKQRAGSAIAQSPETGTAARRTAAKNQKALTLAWRKWERQTQKEQATRASHFFTLSYLWRNGPTRATMLRV